MKPQFDSSHWYRVDGTPAHGAGLKQAREENLLPSVTTILNVLSKPMIVSWKESEAIRCCYKNPPTPTTDEDLYLEIITNIRKNDNKATLDLGTDIHNQIECYLKNGKVLKDGFSPKIVEVVDWLEKNITHYESEKTLVNTKYGFAGKCDLIGVVNGVKTLIDFKTQKNKGKFTHYDTWGYQLAAYGMCEPVEQYISIAIGSDKLGMDVKIWDKESISNSKRVFIHALNIFKIINKIGVKK